MQCYIYSILLRGIEAATLNKKQWSRLEAMEMWLYRKMFRISWMAKISNTKILEKADTKRILREIVIKRKTRYLIHTARGSGVPRLFSRGGSSQS